MKQPTIDVRSGMLFPWHFLFIATIVLIVGFSLVTERTVVSLILIVISTFVLTGYSGTEIDTQRKRFREYRSFFFLKEGKHFPFNGIEKIYINSSRTTQKVHTAHTNHSSVFSSIEYNAWLKFDNGSKVHLLSKGDKGKLMRKLNDVCVSLGTRLEDQTTTS